jgi:MOSC domain-containing protein YiiM
VSAPRRGRVVSVNVGRERLVPWRGRMVPTGIFKEPVAGRIVVRDDHVEGDTVADLRVHGGRDKAVYAYPAEHYAFWRAELPGTDLPWGMFGENLTIEGLLEDGVASGDRFRIGTTELEVTQPRLPCMKLGIKFGRTDIIKRFLRSGRTGFYLAIIRPGDIGAGDAVEAIHSSKNGPTVADLVREAANDD